LQAGKEEIDIAAKKKFDISAKEESAVAESSYRTQEHHLREQLSG
jgi:hypothetical protein